MPKPNKGESKQDFLQRCTGEIMDREGKESDQAFGMCNRIWDDQKSQRAALTLTAPLALSPQENPDSPKTFLITAYTGMVLEQWWGPLIIDTQGIQVNAKMPVLREHARDRVVGFSTKTRIEGATLIIAGEFSAQTADSQEIQALAAEGFPWQASIGVWPKKIKVLGSDKEKETVNGQEIIGPAEIWQESYVREVSFCALGADDETAAIVLTEQQKKVPVTIERAGPKNQEESIMPITLAQLKAEAPALLKEIQETARAEVTLEVLLQKQPQAGEQIRAAGEAAERARVMEILEAKGDAVTSIQCIKDGTALPETFKLLLKAGQEGKAKSLHELLEAMPQPLGQTPPPQGQGDFMGKVSDLLAKGEAKTRGQAIQLAARRYPQLHEEYLQSQQNHQK